jgi:hypothetical protein
VGGWGWVELGGQGWVRRAWGHWRVVCRGMLPLPANRGPQLATTEWLTGAFTFMYFTLRHRVHSMGV